MSPVPPGSARAVVAVDRGFAERVAQVAKLLEADEDRDEPLHRLIRLGVELVPGTSAAAVTIAADGSALTFAASDPRLDDLHSLQFERGDGPAVETLLHSEPRRIDDTATERRWPTFCPAADEAGFASLLVLPLRTDRHPAGAVALYGGKRDVFRGVAHEIALLFAAQGGTALHNAELYQTCRRMVDNLQASLESRAIIEQAKGIVHAELGISPAEAFQLLSRFSQNTNRRVRKIAADLVQGRITAGDLRGPPLVS